MKQILKTGIWIFLTSLTAHGQEELFIPAKPESISDKDYREGLYILKNSYQQVVDDNYNVVTNDNWNFAVAYTKLGQPKEMVYDFLYKSKTQDRNFFCSMVNKSLQEKNLEETGFYKLIGEDFRKLISDCSTVAAEEKFDIDEYIKHNNFDKELIYKLNDLLIEDGKWRSGKDENLEKQTTVDQINILKAEEVIKKYGYPGTKMVGEKFDFVIWLVIQHAELHYQEKYLPLIAKTVDEKQLSKSTLRMLLDRIYHKKTGFQIFGSQVGVPFSDDKTIEAVKLKYNL